jgi:uncharacterized protein (TIGR02246 family)
MIERLPDMPPGTLGFRVAGKVEREDYRDVLVPELHRVLQSGAKLRTLYLIEDLDDIEPGALWADAKLGLDLGFRHHGDWERSAIVTDQEWLARATRLFAWMIPGEARVFGVAELEGAKQWVAGAGMPTDEAAVTALYDDLIGAWNDHDGDAFAAPFAPDGMVIGFDGSEQSGRDAIASEMNRIFADHETAPYVTKVRSVRALGPHAAVLRAVAGMIPPGASGLDPSRNAQHTIVAEEEDGRWRIVLFQNTPAQFHGRPDLAEQLTKELGQTD